MNPASAAAMADPASNTLFNRTWAELPLMPAITHYPPRRVRIRAWRAWGGRLPTAGIPTRKRRRHRT